MMKEIGMKEIEKLSLAYVELVVTDTKKAAYVLSEKLKYHNFKIIENNTIRIYDQHLSLIHIYPGCEGRMVRIV